MTETGSPVSRRNFINRLWAFLGLVAVGEVGWLGLSVMNSLKKRNQPVRTRNFIVAGPMERFTPETVTAVPRGGLYLSCLADGSYLALSRICTHLGCSVTWDADNKRFVCPCHGSTYDLTGEVLTAPASRPLDTFPVRIENGIIKVDIASLRKREHFDPEQATRI